MSIQLHFEPTGICNATCVFCTYASEENRKLPKKPMPMDLYHKIINEAKDLAPITEIAFAGLGEPLLDPHIIERITYAKKARPEWRLEMYTNGVYLYPAVVDALKSAGLDILVISLNAVSAAQHRSIMGLVDKFDRVCRHADYARSCDGIRVEVRAVVTGDTFTQADAQTFIGRWGAVQFGGHGKLILEMNWAGALGRTITPFDPNSCCKRALEQISVHRDGRVNLCCLDPLGKYSWGDLKTQTIREIYNAAGYVEFREWHRDNQAARHPLCKVCTRI